MKIKICGLSRPCDIEFVNEARPDYCGFIIGVPDSRRNVTPERARMLRERLAEGIVPVGVFVDAPVREAAALAKEGVIGAVQLHGNEDEEYIARLREQTDTPVIKAFRVRESADVLRANQSSADHVLLDNGPGGTGERFDWRLLSGMERPYFLAGGLSPFMIEEAAAACARPGARRPEAEPLLLGFDVSSGVETDGYKDKAKILAAVAAVRRCIV